MVFSSILFLYIFLPLFFILYHISNKQVKNYTLLSASIFFYAWGAPDFIFTVLASLTANFYIVKALVAQTKFRKPLLFASIFINMGLLGYFKYANFFIDNINYIIELAGFNAVTWTKVVLPIGISFFTFQSLTYTVDVYRGTHQPLDKLSDYLLYILMFPQLIAGPIIRFNTIADEITGREQNESTSKQLEGFYRFIIGLSKKILIANTLGEQVDYIYALPHAEIDSTLAWIAIVAYTFQIYFDFSGYSDMAIGLGKTLGFNFPENFNNPYNSQSITEFWRRWHITLGTWMRDYLYIPLGGNRVKTQSRLYFNLATVFLLSGLWHGASWNFIIWGAWHGGFLVLDRLFLEKHLSRLPRAVAIILTFIIVNIGWLFFRIENFHDIAFYLSRMFAFDFSTPLSTFKSDFYTTLIIAFIFSFGTFFQLGKKVEQKVFYTNYSSFSHMIGVPLSIFMLLICTSYITASGFNPFIYFRF